MQQQAMKYGLDIRLGEVEELTQNDSDWRVISLGRELL